MTMLIQGSTGKRIGLTRREDADGWPKYLLNGEEIALGDGRFCWERICGKCGTVERDVMLLQFPEETVLVVEGEECRDCERGRMLALDGSPECSTCAEPTDFKPSHMGSTLCQSGSLASGGVRAHCTCDTCF